MNQPDRLYNLLPVVYRQRDLEQGSPLRMLLRVIAEQVNLLETDISRLYENWFIETCGDWVVPYIGDLIGYRPVRSAGEESDSLNPALEQILVPRREVANTIRYRRRKGTLALLDELSLATAGWPARAVEFKRHLSINQNLQHLRKARGHTADLHAVGDLDLMGSAFDDVGHNLDVRSPNSPDSPGRYNLPSVGLFVWRLRVYTASHTLAYCVEEAGAHCFTFSILGNDAPLFTRQVPGQSSRRIPGELDLPVPIRRRAFAERHEDQWRASEEYYGEGKSVAIWVSSWAGLDPNVPVPRERVIPADLSDWKYRPRKDHVAVDPELGRIAFPPGQEPEGDVFTSYCYGFSSEIGGGEYARPGLVSAGHSTFYYVGKDQDYPTIQAAYEQWRKDQPAHALIEISDSQVYSERLEIELGEKQTLQLRAGDGARPIIFLSDARAGRPDPISVEGAPGSTFILEGLLVTGRGVEVRGKLEEFVLRHCTLVPGWGLHPDCAPRRETEPSLVFTKTCARVRIEHSILGPIQVAMAQEGVDPQPVEITDSVLDATRLDADALAAPDRHIAGVSLTLRRSTVLGEIHAHAVMLAENSILSGRVRVARRQLGCMRFCYVPVGSRTPKRYHCQPDLVDQALRERLRPEHLPPDEVSALVHAEHLRVEPAFLSTRYGGPNYCRLSDGSAPEIKTGAEDRSELGVFHDLFQPQREANLRVRLEEFTPAGEDVGIIFVT
jgi:hypothetical protein